MNAGASKFVPVLSYGMGADSTALLLRWIHDPASRDFELSNLAVVTAQTGDEWPDTRDHVERHVLPLLCSHQIRFVQLARGGHLEKDGIVVLDDGRQPQKCIIEGHYKLSDELGISGTVPHFGGAHRCSLKFKAFVIESWLATAELLVQDGAAARVTFGFNAEETGRVAKSAAYDGPRRIGHYPLPDWGWDRARCLAYIEEWTGVARWPKSACVECPFAQCNRDLLARQHRYPSQVAGLMILERLSLAMNPRGQLYRERPLYEMVAQSGNQLALEQFQAQINAAPWAIYRVRRVYQGKGKAQRCVERLEEFPSPVEANDALTTLSRDKHLRLRELHGLRYAYVRERGNSYPAVEEYYVAMLASVDTFARYGLEKFEQGWSKMADLYCGQDDPPLFAGLDAANDR